MSMRRPPSCMTGREYAEWRLADTVVSRSPRRRHIPTDPCADCTPEFRADMADLGLCDQVLRPDLADPVRATLRRVLR